MVALDDYSFALTRDGIQDLTGLSGKFGGGDCLHTDPRISINTYSTYPILLY